MKRSEAGVRRGWHGMRREARLRNAWRISEIQLDGIVVHNQINANKFVSVARTYEPSLDSKYVSA